MSSSQNKRNKTYFDRYEIYIRKFSVNEVKLVNEMTSKVILTVASLVSIIPHKGRWARSHETLAPFRTLNKVVGSFMGVVELTRN